MGRRGNVNPADVHEDHVLERGFPNRLDRCPACSAIIFHREPMFDHCVVCGRYWLIRGTSTSAQVRYERASGNARHLVDPSERIKTSNGNGQHRD